MAKGLRGQMLARISAVVAAVSVALVAVAGVALVSYECANEAEYETDAVGRVVSSLEARELSREQADALLTTDYLNRLHMAGYMLDEAAAKTGTEAITSELCRRVAEAIEVDALHVIGPDGVVVASSMPQSEGLSFYDHEELSEFIPLIEGREPSGHHVELTGTSLALGEEQTFVGVRDGDLTLQIEVSPWRTAGYRDGYSVASYFSSLPDPDYRTYFAVDATDGSVVATSGAEVAELGANLDKLVDVVSNTGMRLSHIVNGMGGGIEGFEYFDALSRAYYSHGLLELVGLDDEEFRRRMREAVDEVRGRGPGAEVERSMTFLRSDGRALEVHVLLSASFAYGLVEDVSDRVRHELELEQRAERAERRTTHDELTGLSNRGGLTAAVEAELGGRRRGTLLLMDLDNFKLVNDGAGHREGDAVLQEFAALLGRSFRSGDVKARMGGDEFAVFMPGVSDSRAVVEKASAFIAESHRALSGHRDRFGLSVSVGAATLGPYCRDFASLYETADAAMYEAKRGGKDGFCLAGEGTSQLVGAGPAALAAALTGAPSASRRDELLDALARGEFRAWYQPQCDVLTGRVVGVEALARWHRPDGRVELPTEFVVPLEWEGLAKELDLTILRDVCDALAAWEGDVVTVSFNMSRASLSDESIVGDVRAILETTGARASWLKVEVTEDNPAESEELLDRALEGLRGLGLEIALDDFGAGYSSLASVGAHRFDELKLDASLVGEIGTRRGEKVVSIAVSLAHELGMSVVAEGVESERQLEFLALCGCEVVQGFYFGGPLPRPAFEGAMRRAAAGASRSPRAAARAAHAADQGVRRGGAGA